MHSALPPSTEARHSTPLRARALRIGVILALMPLALGGCAVFRPIPQTRGSLIEKDDYAALKPGTSTRADVLDALGSPTSHATFNDNVWIYVTMVTSPTPLSFPHVDKQQVVVLAFDNGGVLRSLDTLHKKDAMYVGMVGDKTPTPGSHNNILQELLGNVGRYNPMSNMSSFGGSQGPLGSSIGTGNGGQGNSLP
ncbi:outer membrane protein assembly factor BamE [Brytella acorum]|uniref:Outer membrane protein assembly factor BamE n=1 Tax=Brytella acorum TaxID=2959299 RepID=A0AA35V0W5_9PROT|nr:outer membrane protein assembly factor BamE [Brytella acorum]MDF3624149.1 outer membrane protein assembly factor BamE [Brytella acorum]CAI9120655.1 outer membrane protein assembly factor BamE [Brytella acorum]